MRLSRVIISDTHLGKKVASADYLLEFLTAIFLDKIKVDEIFLNGDILDGWKLTDSNRKPFPEMHARVLDALWALNAKGVKLTYIPGNHDEDLRREKKFRNRNFIFDAVEGLPPISLHFKQAAKFDDQQGRRTLVLHGDQFDKTFSEKAGGRFVSRIGDRAYDALVHTNNAMLKLAQKINKDAHFSIASYIKRKTKKTVGIIASFENAVTGPAISDKFDVVACGHIHHAEVRKFETANKRNILYVNSGDWVESCTAAVQNEHGDWSIMRWFDERSKFGFDDLPLETDENIFESFRPYTIQMVGFMRDLWPGKNAVELAKKVIKLSEELEKRRQVIDDVDVASLSDPKLNELFLLATADFTKIREKRAKVLAKLDLI